MTFDVQGMPELGAAREPDDAFTGATPFTILDEVEAELSKDASRDPVVLPVERRPRFSMRFDTNIDGDLLNAWRRKSVDRSTKAQDIDALKLSCLIIGNQAIELLRDGKVIVDRDNRPLNFRQQALLQMVHAHDVIDAVRKLYGGDSFAGDGDILNVAAKISDLAGYGLMDVDEEDPTTAL